MPAIGIIDDRKGERKTLTLAVDVNIPKESKEGGWSVNDSPPLTDLNDYSSWLTENDIAALIIDERLNEQTATGVDHVNYQGHNVVDYIRYRFPNFPIYIVTAHPDDQDVKDRYKDVEEIADRTTFTRNAKKTVPRLIRAGQRYFQTYKDQLAELSKMAEKVALGKETDDDVENLKALQTFLQIPFITDPDTERVKTLSELEEKLSKFEELKKEIEAHLNKGKAKAKKK